METEGAARPAWPQVPRRVYLSGPVTGVEGRNMAAFDEAEALVRERLGDAATVVNPVHIVPEGATHEEAMAMCLSELCATYYGSPVVTELVRLPGWAFSTGARLEDLVAEACGIARSDLAAWEAA